ncbi:MAG: undecaprenyl-phosphate glucose phosphotransferase [Pseudolabrys sp.]|nr:undecaprenyl-phosphate glucose phosphotransferase [Pseudolabrys sp.]
MIKTDTRAPLNAAGAAAVIDRLREGPATAPKKVRSLSPEALAIADKISPPPISPIVLAGVVRIAEFVLIVAVGMAIVVAYIEPLQPQILRYLAAILTVAGLSTLAFQTADIYQVHAFRGHEKQYMRLASAWSVVFLIVIGASFFLKAGELFSRVWLGAFFVCGLAALITSRKLLYYAVRKWTREGRLTRRTVIVGGGEPGERVIAELRNQKDTGIEIIGWFDDRGGDRGGTDCAGEPKLGSVEDLVEFGRRTRVDLVIFSLPISAENRILAMLKKLWVLPLDIRLAAHTNKLQFRPRSYSYIGKVPVIDVFDRPIADWDVVMKWLFDKVIGSILLLLALPLLALIAIVIKLDSRGPVLFKQKRYGFNNDLVEVYKFRSMYTDMTDAHASKLVTKDDPRVTRVGRIIRKASLDELPQLFNVVFNSNLSLVGPRPHAVNAKAEARLYAEAVDGYFARHRVKPGITGWAQINGWRGETDTHDKIQNRVEHDLYYIENWSVLLDLYILLRTPFALLKTENAY